MSAVESLASSLSVRVHDVLLAGWAALLGRYASQKDVLVGSPVANRDRPEHASSFGCLVDERVFRARMVDDPAFATLATRLADERRSTRPHRDLPIAELLAALEPARTPPRPPLYQVLFNYMEFDVAQVSAPGLSITSSRLPPVGAMLELSLEVVRRETEIELTLEVDLDSYQPEDGARILKSYLTLLEAALAAPEAPVSRLPILTSDELHSLERWNQRDAPESLDTTMDRLLAQELEGNGADTVLRSATGGPSVSRALLRSRVARLAQLLSARGIGVGSRVAIWHEEPIAAVEAILAVLCAGAAYVPISADAPLERAQDILRDAEPALLLGGPSHALPDDICPRLGLDELDQAISGMAEAFPPPRARPEDPAYLLYTSGTTGRPKGVVVSHRNLVYQLRARELVYDDAPTRFLLTYSFAFDASVAGLFWTLTRGGELILTPPELRADPAGLRAAIQRFGITHFDSVPTIYAAMLDGASPQDFASVRLLVLGGEALTPPLLERHRALLPHVRLFNEYGPTEATVFCSALELTDAPLGPRVPIGGPIPGARFYVVDEHGERVPIGHPGELWVGGRGVADGYWRLPALTEERFSADPFLPGERVYRTGDRVRWREDGTLDFLGRMDRQVKLRGARFELDEVEAVLRTHPAVLEAIAGLQQAPKGPFLVAYVTTRAPGETERGLRRFLAERLPRVMVPSQVLVVDALPIGPNGKLDRALMPTVPQGPASRTTRPLTETERQVARVWSALLGTTEVAPDDDFFELGGHSLLAVKMLQEVRANTGIHMPIRQFFQRSTLAELAAGAGGDTALRIIEPVRAHGTSPPIFFVGSVLYPRALAKVLPDDMPVYGLNFFGLCDESVPLPQLTVESIAAAYLREMQIVRPHGPYALVGFCLESSIAYEMARQLREMGESVVYLGLIDFYPDPPRSNRRMLRQALFQDLVGELRRRSRRRWAYAKERLEASVVRVQRRLGALAGRPSNTLSEHVELLARLDRAVERYRYALPSYEGNAELLLASEWGIASEARLERAVPHLQITVVEGYHDGFFAGEQLEHLARRIALGVRRRASG